MTLLFIAIVLVGVLGAALGAYAILAPKKTASVPVLDTAVIEPGEIASITESDWTHEAGPEFAGLGESARCDLIFALAALSDEASERLLVHALDDPSETVALAAAHALARGGRIEAVRAYAECHAGPRAAELLQLVALLA